MLKKSSMLLPQERILLAWDRSDFNSASRRQLLTLVPDVGGVKAGFQSLTALGPDGSCVFWDVCLFCRDNGIVFMADLKLKDIQNTVVETIKNLVGLGIQGIVTIHATMRMGTIIAALEATKGSDLLIAGVTILTDHEDDDARRIYGLPVRGVFLNGARNMSAASKHTGVPAAIVCSPVELGILREEKIRDEEPGLRLLTKITPGIRSKDDPPDHQKRTRPAGEAARAGADYEVIGRPILKANDPVMAARKLGAEISEALAK